ncbi:MAG: hypothetical protein KatS3mg031_2311 [Chitinophagales bacterium]|nr:MAG: hypothetical protein KatS3mg031_2311 [Chitinophagales bacterium]
MRIIVQGIMVVGLLILITGGVVFFSITQWPESRFTRHVIIPLVKPLVDLTSRFTQHKEVEKTSPAFILSASELQAEFLQGEELAKEKYIGKVVQVHGTIAKIASPADTTIVLLLAIDADPLSNVSCQMDPRYNERVKDLNVGDMVSVKGICNGIKKDDLLGSTDVVLNRCVVALGN